MPLGDISNSGGFNGHGGGEGALGVQRAQARKAVSASPNAQGSPPRTQNPSVNKCSTLRLRNPDFKTVSQECLTEKVASG